MPIRAIVNTARTLSYYLRLQEVTSNNLANANTPGFKAERVQFSDFIDRQTGTKAPPDPNVPRQLCTTTW